MYIDLHVKCHLLSSEFN